MQCGVSRNAGSQGIHSLRSTTTIQQPSRRRQTAAGGRRQPPLLTFWAPGAPGRVCWRPAASGLQLVGIGHHDWLVGAVGSELHDLHSSAAALLRVQLLSSPHHASGCCCTLRDDRMRTTDRQFAAATKQRPCARFKIGSSV